MEGAALSMTSAFLFQELKCSPKELGLGDQGLEPTGEEALPERVEAGIVEAGCCVCRVWGHSLASSGFLAATCLPSS